MGVLLMLMTIGGLGAAFILLVISFWKSWSWLRSFVLLSTAIWFVFYGVILFGMSFLSEERTLSLNEPKNYCGFYLDCHMHTAVTGVRKAKTLGDKEARGEFYIVSIRVFSDAKRASLGLADVDARVRDAAGNEFVRDPEAEANLSGQPPFDRRISPTESFVKEIVFDLPSDISGPRLDIREGNRIDRAIESVLIGDEDSLWHKRNYFKLEGGESFAKTDR
ncbi:MAG: hypothetical protein R2747_14955 [Pyrinomonadaceae bacterium]